jgi:hypothetical protein
LRHEGRYRVGALAACACFVALWIAGLVVLAYGSILLGVALMVLGGMGAGIALLASSRDKGGLWELIVGVLGELFGSL